MIRYLPFAVVLAMAACGNVTATPNGAIVTNPLQKLASLTDADLKSAIAEAQAATPPDTEAVACFTFLDSNLAGLQSGTAAAPTGVISAFEVAHLGIQSAGALISSAQKTALEQACGPYALSVQGGVLALGNLLGVAVIAAPK